ncbi:MAG TPA: F0F1 ATP synthase subunit epsilon [Thioploca sp.]|jgi:F-type H+-transporting ATPase subunit epsilon|nr:MAG: F0F1 ATP synthase subunit epsilon [Beggiatoa sp. 4572_84]RKZ57554.1 MAG: F0F1 ATP synthase subunit epsilon [Gammaproteobacteria bacterium]HDN27836.1 F0F1 ATP synthase subunit epsilon [Thioploca sp.]
MAMTVHVDIVSAEAEIFSGLAEMVIAPAMQGEVGIMPRHAQYITPLSEGAVRLKIDDDHEESFYISGGLLEVQPHKVTVLSDAALRAYDIDEKAALEAKQRAEKRLSDKQAAFDYTKAQAELAEAMLQLRAVEKLRQLKK